MARKHLKHMLLIGLLLMAPSLVYAQKMPISSMSLTDSEQVVKEYRVLGEAKALHRKGRDKKAYKLLKKFVRQTDSLQFESLLNDYVQIYREFSRRKLYRWKRKEGASFDFQFDTLRVGNDQAVVFRVHAMLNGSQLPMTVDTGSGINILTPALADSLSLRKLGLKVPFEGEEIGEGELALADELRIGSLRFQNVPFVVADVSTGIDSIDAHLSYLHALLGLPLFEVMRTLEIDVPSRRVSVSEPISGIERNLFYDEMANELLVEVRHHEETLRLIPDFGASHTVLGADYFARHQDWIRAYCDSREVFFAGVGGITSCHEYAFRQFDLKLGQLVFTLPTATVVDIPYDNRLGMDFFSRCRRIVFDFNRMSLLAF